MDTVVGQRAGREAVVFTAVEKVTRNYIAIRIPGRTCAGVEAALAQLQELYGAEYFSQIFKTMTADNGPEFENLSQFESLGTKMYFTLVQLVGAGSKRTPQWLAEGFHPKEHVHRAVL